MSTKLPHWSQQTTLVGALLRRYTLSWGYNHLLDLVMARYTYQLFNFTIHHSFKMSGTYVLLFSDNHLSWQCDEMTSSYKALQNIQFGQLYFTKGKSYNIKRRLPYTLYSKRNTGVISVPFLLFYHLCTNNSVWTCLYVWCTKLLIISLFLLYIIFV